MPPRVGYVPSQLGQARILGTLPSCTWPSPSCWPINGFTFFCEMIHILITSAPSITNMSDSSDTIMSSVQLEIEANKTKAQALAEELRDLNKKRFEQEAMIRAKEKLDEKQTYKNNWLTHKDQKPNAIIKPEVRELIRENVIGNGMKTSEAMKAFKVSCRQVQRIKAEDPNLVKTHKKRQSKFSHEMKTKLLHQLDQQSSTTLPEMVHFIKE